MAQPLEQFFTVGCGKDGVQGVASVHTANARRNSKQVQVMVAKHNGGLIA